MVRARALTESSQQIRAGSNEAALVVIVLALVAHGEYRDRIAAVDLEERDVAGRAERDHEFPEQRIGAQRLAAGEGGEREQAGSFLDGLQRALEEKIVKAEQIRLCLASDADAIAPHYPVARRRAATSRRRSLPITRCAGT